jgi:hypothetical protein
MSETKTIWEGVDGLRVLFDGEQVCLVSPSGEEIFLKKSDWHTIASKLVVFHQPQTSMCFTLHPIFEDD